MENPSLRANLVQNAKTLVESKYSPERLTEILCKEMMDDAAGVV
jgi:hypothetical protein